MFNGTPTQNFPVITVPFMAIYKNVTSSVKINNMHTDSFACTDGLRQGDK